MDGVVEVKTEENQAPEKVAAVCPPHGVCPPHDWVEVNRYISWSSSGPSALDLLPPPGVPFTVVDGCRRCDAKRKRFEERYSPAEKK